MLLEETKIELQQVWRTFWNFKWKQTHIGNTHSDEDGEATQNGSTPSNEPDSSFFFSESMLDEFVDNNFLNGL